MNVLGKIEVGTAFGIRLPTGKDNRQLFSNFRYFLMAEAISVIVPSTAI